MTIPTVAYNDDQENCIIHQPYTAFLQGVEAYDLGHKLTDNPYQRGTFERHWWKDGWIQSKKGTIEK